MKAITLVALVILTSVTIHYWAALVAAAPAESSQASSPSGEEGINESKKSSGPGDKSAAAPAPGADNSTSSSSPTPAAGDAASSTPASSSAPGGSQHQPEPVVSEQKVSGLQASKEKPEENTVTSILNAAGEKVGNVAKDAKETVVGAAKDVGKAVGDAANDVETHANASMHSSAVSPAGSGLGSGGLLAALVGSISLMLVASLV